jgi:hypothetical protein
MAAAVVAVLVPGSAAAGDAPGGVQPNIIGGHAASEPYPWMVSVQIQWKGDPHFHTCGGVLLFRDQVVTNALEVGRWDEPQQRPVVRC